MTQSRFLAGIIGPTLAALALSVLINRSLFDQMVANLSSDYLLIVVVGAATMVVGLAIVLTHNVWKGWPAVITAFGWLGVIGGFVRMVFPSQVADLAPQLFGAVNGGVLTAIAVVLILFGGFLSWKAFAKA